MSAGIRSAAAQEILSELGLPPNRWRLPDPAERLGGPGDDTDELVAIGADLHPSTLISAYCHGLFPMPLRRPRRVAWWSPDPRGIIDLDEFGPSRSLRRSVRRFDARIDSSFAEVMRRCADPRRQHGWISRDFVAAYSELHRIGVAHSVEVYSGDRLVGGLYGVHLRGLFAGESMFHEETDASKVALVHLVDHLRSTGAVLLDVQWVTPHLASLGATAITREHYLDLLSQALTTTG